MLIQSSNSEQMLEICPNCDISLKHSIHTHVIDGDPQGCIEVDMHCPWWALSPEQQAELLAIREQAQSMVDRAAAVILGSALVAREVEPPKRSDLPEDWREALRKQEVKTEDEQGVEAEESRETA